MAVEPGSDTPSQPPTLRGPKRSGHVEGHPRPRKWQGEEVRDSTAVAKDPAARRGQICE